MKLDLAPSARRQPATGLMVGANCPVARDEVAGSAVVLSVVSLDPSGVLRRRILRRPCGWIQTPTTRVGNRERLGRAPGWC